MSRSGTLLIKIFNVFSLAILFCLLAVTYKVYQNDINDSKKRACDFMVALREAKKNQIEWYFEQVKKTAIMYSDNYAVVEAMKAFRNALDSKAPLSKEKKDSYSQELKKFYENEFLKKYHLYEDENKDLSYFFPSDDRSIELQYKYIVKNPHPYFQKYKMDKIVDVGAMDQYDKAHEKYHQNLTEFVNVLGFDDIMLVDYKTGFVVYSSGKKIGFATNLLTGSFKDTHMAAAFKQASSADVADFVKITDFEAYDPAFGKPTAFITSPIFDGQTIVGVFIAHINIEVINSIVTFYKMWRDIGLGESGEVYLIGSDYKVRSSPRFFLEKPNVYYQALTEHGTHSRIINKIKLYGSPILLHEITEFDVREALKGRTNVIISKNYYGKDAIIAYTPLKIQGLSWYIISLMDTKEAVYDGAHQRIKFLILWLLFIMLLILLIVFLYLRHLLAPFTSLVTVLGLMSKDQQIAVHALSDQPTNDELGVVHESLREWISKFARILEKMRSIAQKYITNQELLETNKNKVMTTTVQAKRKIEQLVSIQVEKGMNHKSLDGDVQKIGQQVHVLGEQPESLKTDIVGIEKEYKQAELIIKECHEEGHHYLELLNNCLHKLNQSKDLPEVASSLERVASMWKNVIDKITRLSNLNNSSFDGTQKLLAKVNHFSSLLHKLHQNQEELVQKSLLLQNNEQRSSDVLQESLLNTKTIEEQLKELHTTMAKFSELTQQLEQHLVSFKVS